MEVIEVTEREVEIIEVIERGPQGPTGPTGPQGPAGAGGVTSVSGTAPIVSSGGTTPAISISAATTSAAGSMSSADKTKLDGIATGATANSSDATLLARANHTGTQAHTTITGLGDLATQNAATPPTLGGTTPAAATFTNLTANTRLNLPSTNGTTAGDLYRNADTLRYRDGTNAERLLLNASDNLANLASASAARTNLGVGSSDAVTFGSIQNTPIGSTTAAAITGTTGTFTTLNATNGTITASAPVLDLSQTWNASGTTFTALRLNATNTASASGSLLMDLQVGGTSVANIRRDGRVLATSFAVVAGAQSGAGFSYHSATEESGHIQFVNNVNTQMWTCTASRFRLAGDLSFGRSVGLGQSVDTVLVRDDVGTLAQRNAANAQTFRLYNTTDAGLTNHERGFLRWSSNVFQIGTEKGGTGSARALELSVNGNRRFFIGTDGGVGVGSTTGLLVANGLYVDVPANNSSLTSPAITIRGSTSVSIDNGGNNVLRISGDRLNFGGTTSSFPALKQSSTTLQVRLADDSAFAPLQASQFNGPSDANLTIAARGTTALTFDGNEMYMARQLNGQGNNLYNFATIGFGNASSIGDAVFARDAADTIAQRRGLNAQTYRIYNTVSGTNNVNFERANFRWVANEFIIDAEAGGTGTSLRGIKIGSATSSLLGFYGATPAAQPAAVADATDAATVITQLNALLARLRTIGIIAT